MISFKKIFSSKSDSLSTPNVPWETWNQSLFKQSEGTHIWKIRWPDISSQTYLDYLSDEEYRKVLCYSNPKDRNKRIISLGILKELSSKYLNLPCKSLTLETNSHGKPYFANSYNLLQFNISHSTGFILLAFSFKGQNIGIDIEENKLLFNYLDIADQYFTESEKLSLSCDSPAEQFFKIWTRKEALIKANGNGLTDELLEVDILKDEINLNAPYFFKTFKIGAEYIFSIVNEAPLNNLQFIEY